MAVGTEEQPSGLDGSPSRFAEQDDGNIVIVPLAIFHDVQ